MSPAFIAFSISLSILIVLVLHKIWEIKKGHTFISKTVIPKSDFILEKQIEKQKEIIVGGSKRGFLAVTSLTKESVKRLILVFAHYLQNELGKIIVKIKGKSLKHKSGVSFFLKRMGDIKEEEKNIKQDMPKDESNIN